MSRLLFTSESVTEGHPDKIADQISDAVLDAMLRDDPMSRVACETLVTTGMAIVAGEITTTSVVDLPDVIRQTIVDIGYETLATLRALGTQAGVYVPYRPSRLLLLIVLRVKRAI